MFGRTDCGHEAAETFEQLDGREVSFGGETAVEQDMPVEQRAHRIDDGIHLIVAFHQHGVEGGD